MNKESLSLPTLFMDYDKFNVGDITEAGMERALGGACLLPPEPVFRAIVKKFREHSRRSSGGEVNYRAFLAAVRLRVIGSGNHNFRWLLDRERRYPRNMTEKAEAWGVGGGL